MDVSRFFRRYDVRRLERADIPEIYSLCSKNERYYQHCPPFVTEQSILDDMNALPPGKAARDKHYVGYFDGGKLIAVMDLIMAYPDERTAWIGFFMTDVSVQNTGIGSSVIGDLCAYLPDTGITAVRLGWVKGNPQAEHFWHKNRFLETGVTNGTSRCTIVEAQRLLYT